MGKYTGKWQEICFEKRMKRKYSGSREDDSFIEFVGPPYRVSHGFCDTEDDYNIAVECAVIEFLKEYGEFCEICPECGEQAYVYEDTVMDGERYLCLKCWHSVEI